MCPDGRDGTFEPALQGQVITLVNGNILGQQRTYANAGPTN